MEIFDGKTEAANLDNFISKKVTELIHEGSLKDLLIIQIGDNPVSEKYLQLKVKLCDKLCIPVHVHKLDEHRTDFEIVSNVKALFHNQKVGGGIIQLPLPRQSLSCILDLIPLEKDIDILSKKAQVRYYCGDFRLLSPVVRAVKSFIEKYKIDVKGKRVIIIGKGFLVGKPVGHYLRSAGADVHIIDCYEKRNTLDCHLLVLSAGVRGLVFPKDIVKGCSVVDFGSSIVEGKTIGDLNQSGDLSHLKYVSFSPGGMGPLVVRFLLMNHLGM